MQLYISTCAAMAMSTLAIWCRVVHSRDVSPYIFDGPAMSGLAFSLSVAPLLDCVNGRIEPRLCTMRSCVPNI